MFWVVSFCAVVDVLYCRWVGGILTFMVGFLVKDFGVFVFPCILHVWLTLNWVWVCFIGLLGFAGELGSRFCECGLLLPR